MKISKLIIHLNNLRKEHGDLDVLGVAPEYDPEYNIEEDNVFYADPIKFQGVKQPAIYIAPPN